MLARRAGKPANDRFVKPILALSRMRNSAARRHPLRQIIGQDVALR
jgi:hypothetical protein